MVLKSEEYRAQRLKKMNTLSQILRIANEVLYEEQLRRELGSMELSEVLQLQEQLNNERKTND